MKLHVRERLHDLHPRHAFLRWRDEIDRRAARIPLVRNVRERYRAARGSSLRRELEWALAVELPLLARALVPPEALRFALAEEWDEERLDGTWALRSLGLPEDAASARGEMRFDEEGLVVQGEVVIDPAAVPPLARASTPALERAIARAIERGFRELAGTLR